MPCITRTPVEITVDLRYEADVLTLRVSDDGCGFDPTYLGDDRHYGLLSMKERAAVVGGRLTVATARRAGHVGDRGHSADL